MVHLQMWVYRKYRFYKAFRDIKDLRGYFTGERIYIRWKLYLLRLPQHLEEFRSTAGAEKYMASQIP